MFLEQFFPNVHLEGFKIGAMSSEILTSFGDDPLRVFMSKTHCQPSKTSVYAVKAGEVPKVPKVVDKKKRRRSLTPSPDRKSQASTTESIPPIKEQDIAKGKHIGVGGSANVWEGTWLGSKVALKEYRLNDLQEVKVDWKTEVALHLNLRHPNVLQLYGLCDTPESIMVVSELMDTNLEEVIRKKKPKRETQLLLALSIVRGVEYLHQHAIVHGDIKPHNILVSSDMLVAKVCDFGLSRVKLSSGVTQVGAVPGTVQYMAPESIVEGVKSNFQSDVWSTGATLAELFCGPGIPPWKVPKGKKTYNYVTAQMEKQMKPDILKALESKDEALHDIVRQCLVYKPDHRLTIDELKNKVNQQVA